MKLSDHTEKIRQLIDKAFRNRLGRMGISSSGLQTIDNIPEEYLADRTRIENIHKILINETGTSESAYEKLVEEFTFTLFNRIAALKVMEAHTLHAEIITRRTQHGNRSFAHFLWLERNPQGRILEQEGLVEFLENQLSNLAGDIPLFSIEHPYHLLPTAIELNAIISAFNQVENDAQVEDDMWKSDDVLGWLYESYNNAKKAAHKESGDKTEYDKVSIQSQVYTPRWVVKFLVDNSLGKLYLEMFPDSAIKEQYKIANPPQKQTRDRKPITEIRLMDPATGSGNYLFYGFDFFYDLYLDQVDNYKAQYDENEITELIVRHNLHGIDLDDRAIQLAQLGLYIKAKRKNRNAKIKQFNIVSSDFFLPDYNEVKHLFQEEDKKLDAELEKIVTDLWKDLQQAYKFGSLIRLEEKFNIQVKRLEERYSKDQLDFLKDEETEKYRSFRQSFFGSLKKAIAQNTAKHGVNFLNTKTHDAITFLQLLTQKYDVAVANPPYTDSADFGHELKKFVEANYKKPYKFNTNLYATFIKRCCELIDDQGKVALVHPPTFMYIKTFEDVRKYMIEKMQISLFVEWGYLGMFNPTARVDSAMYILEKEKKEIYTNFIKLNDLYEGKRYQVLFDAYDDLLENRPNQHNYILDQSKLKIIEGWPFIYWISDGFREKFKEKALEYFAKNSQGMSVSNGEKYQRFHWEVTTDMISFNHKLDKKKWVPFTKGGPFSKWYGNNWLLVNWLNDGYELKNFPKAAIRNQEYYFLEGLTYSSSGSKGSSFRYLPENFLFSGGGPSITLKSNLSLLNYLCGFLNSQMSLYLLDCFNPTVNTTQGDLNRIPFVIPSKKIENGVSSLAANCIRIKKHLCSFHIIETNYEKTPLTAYLESTLKERIFTYLNYENAQLTQVLLNEAIINELIFEVYELSDEDRLQVETKMGKPVGSLPVLSDARSEYLSSANINNGTVDKFIDELAVTTFDNDKVREIKEGFETLYQSNNDLEEFCIRHQVNPINVLYWFKEAKVLPKARAAEIALEFIADSIRTILANDDDGIIPLVGQLGEEKLLDRLEKHCIDNGLTQAQFLQLEELLGRPLNDYLENNFFKDLSDHLNLFMYLPKTPFIWHLSSGEHQGLEVYISIYKWNRNNLFRLKSYVSKRVENLEYRQIQLKDSNTAQAQSEKETIRLQLQELQVFTKKIEELISEGYDPKLDDGVGKNIAPLQKKGMLRCEVLNKKQLEKYLKADW